MGFAKRLCLPVVLLAFVVATPAFGQKVKKPVEKVDDDVVFDNTKPKKPVEDDDDNVVFDNRSDDVTEQEEFDNAATYATTAPDAATARALRFRPGFHFGFQISFALPGGKYQDSNTSVIADGVTGVLGGGIDVGYRFTPNLIVALDVGAGYVFANNCPNGASCSGLALQGGPQAQWRFLPFAEVVPWAGLGFGYEYFSQTVSVGGASITRSVHGFKFVDARAGVDFLTARTYAGPYVAFALGQYGSAKASLEGSLGESSSSRSIDDKALHHWLTFGLHGTFE